MIASIENFPVRLRPIIENKLLQKEFEAAFRVRLGYRMCAERETVDTPELGMSITNIRDGRADGSKESYTYNVEHYGPTYDSQIGVSPVGIVSQFLLNAAVHGKQAWNTLNGLARNALYSAFGNKTLRSTIIRPLDRTTTKDLKPDDCLTFDMLDTAVDQLIKDEIPPIDDFYNCYLDPTSVRELFEDDRFRSHFKGASSTSQIFLSGMVNEHMRLRFVVIPEAFVTPHPQCEGTYVRTTFVVGSGALIEGSCSDMVGFGVALDSEHPDKMPAFIDTIDGVATVIREPDPKTVLRTMTQAWYWVGGYGPVIDRTDPTSPAFKRAVMLEHM